MVSMLMIALAPGSLSASALVLVWEYATGSRSGPKKLVTTTIRAKFPFAGTAWGSVSETSPLSPVRASRSAICATPVAKTLVLVWAWASALEQAFARCDPRPCEHREWRRFRFSRA